MSIIKNIILKNLPAHPFGLFFSLSTGTLIPHDLWISRRFRIKFFLRGMVMPVLTYRLLKMITRHPYYENILLTQPRLPCRIHRPYLSSKLSAEHGLAAILHHYERMKAFLDDDDFSLHISETGLTIAYLEGKDGETYTLNFISTHKLDREGEATIVLKDQTGHLLAEISFTLCCRSNEYALIIGGIQGPNSQDAQQRIHKATKNFHGIFPKRVVLDTLRLLSQLMDVKSIYAVTNKTHVYKSLRYNNRRKYIHANYDSFWETSGGCQMMDGYYQLPIILKRKNIDDIVSKKRAEYRRRYNFMDDINMQITTQLTRSKSTLF